MVRYHDEDERERISWREIDRRKDRSPHAPKEMPEERKRSRRSEWVMKKFRKEADKLFMGKKGTQKHEKARSDIDRYHGTEQFETAVRAYLDQYGLPDDWRTLSLLLDYSEAETVLRALSAMKDVYESRTPVEKQGFKAKVDILAMTAPNSDLRDFAEEIVKTL
jgi:CRISPR/Cas system-associated exonuclease Cas4 (RecB family)